MTKNQATIAVYVDLQNVRLFPKLVNPFRDFVKSKGDLKQVKIYYNSQCKDQIDIVKKLKSLGCDCRDVPCPLKNSADNQLKSDLLDDIEDNNPPDLIILVSGDGDFKSIVSLVKKSDKYVVIVAQKGNVKQELINLPDEFHFLEDLVQSEKQKNQAKTTSLSTKVNWDDAIECLFNSIETAFKEKKPTTLANIGKLMRHTKCFPEKCNKFPCICKSDGRTFSKLKKFIDAVIEEGLVVMQNDRIFITNTSK